MKSTKCNKTIIRSCLIEIRNDQIYSPVNSIVIACSTEELQFLKRGGTWEGAGNGRVKTQERVKGCGAFKKTKNKKKSI